MKIKRVVIELNERRRLLLHPEGKMYFEAYVDGCGWRATEGEATALAAVLDAAAGILNAKALDLLLAQPWTAAEILAREG